MSAKFIAEVSSNHNRNLDRCFRFIDKAAEIGCDAVKFQLFKAKELFSPEILSSSAEHRKRENWELPIEFLPELSHRCRLRGIQFACTPFYIAAVDELFQFVDFYKIASYELLWKDLLVACAKTGKPVVLSTGMATLDEVCYATDILRNAGCTNFMLLHCISCYPSPPNECNLAAIKRIRQACNCPVGWSDHSVNAAVIYRAVFRWGAEMIEFHLDLDEKGAEYLSGHCWLPEQITPVIKGIKDGIIADGCGQKVPAACELSDRDWRADPSDGMRPLKKIRERWR